MPIKYYKLFDMLNRKGVKKTELLEMARISSPTLAKLSKGDTVNTDTIAKLCKALNCQPEDIMEYEEEVEKHETHE
ncbi:MAG: putative transcriptional regulator [Eubacteriaceae bacterium]|nr:putative transcriptional regulator [Eubacteriaceae bacterium]